jgi:sucrose-6-phosphate hydrolase SacC (GH32 family)
MREQKALVAGGWAGPENRHRSASTLSRQENTSEYKRIQANMVSLNSRRDRKEKAAQKATLNVMHVNNLKSQGNSNLGCMFIVAVGNDVLEHANKKEYMK